MPRRRAVPLVIALAIGLAGFATLLVVWRPWDPVPDELRATAHRVEQIPGVVGADVSYTVGGVGSGTGHEGYDHTTGGFSLDPIVASSTLTVRLDPDLTPEAAGAAAEHAAAMFGSAEVPATSLGRRLVFEAGTPRTYGGSPVAPLDVSTTLDPGEQVTDAYALWHAGAVRVSNLMAWSDDPSGLVDLARFAADGGIAVSLSTVDAAASYDGYGHVPDLAAVELAVAASQRDGVEIAAFGASTDPDLTVHLTGTTRTPQADAVVDWLETSARRAGLAEPVAFTVSGTGYANLREGWIGDAAPPEPAKHTVALPDDVDAWTADDSAPACAGDDLDLSLSAPDAAAGSRFLSVQATNASGHPCALDGTPDLTFLDADGEAQEDVTLAPSSPGVVPGRVVVPDGASVLATVQWGAMSTTLDPDVTTAIDVVPVDGAAPVRLVPERPDGPGITGGPTTLDVLDGAEVRVSPWTQAASGWAVPDDRS